ncbi:MAG: nucleotidyltransferase domain-containing protein [Candidatus Eisenbacteria bacterium]
MPQYDVGREAVLDAMRGALEPLDYVQAMWEAGAVSFDRVDEWSDIDLQVACDDDRVEDVFGVVERTLATLSAVDVRYRLPEPTWHGHSQAFYTLEGASPFLMLDFVVMKSGAEDKFLQPAIHGRPRVYFDKTGVVRFDPLDAESFARTLRERVAELRVLFGLFQILTKKELNRGNVIEAVAFYQSYTLRPLVQALRILHDPTRHNFHTRYVHYDLPASDVTRLTELMFIADEEDLAAKRKRAEEWFHELLGKIGEGPFSDDIRHAASRTGGREHDE